MIYHLNMKYTDKLILFDEFRNKWGEELLDKVFGAVNILASYPEISRNLENITKFEKEEFYSNQLEWVSLVAQFDHPMDKDFFKDHWLTIQKDSYDFFIDISSESLRLFELDFFSDQPESWYCIPVCDDLNDFLSDISNGNMNYMNFFSDFIKRKELEVSKFWTKREELGFRGEIVPTEIELEEMVIDENFAVELTDGLLTAYSVYPLILTVLPSETIIVVEEALNTNVPLEEIKDKLETIQALHFYMTSRGYSSFYYYKFTFDFANEGIVAYENGIFYLLHKSQEFLKDIKQQLDRLKP